MEFPKLFPGARLIRLEENYRSTQAILDLTNAIIDRAEEKYAKRLFTRTTGGEKPVLHGARDESDEARFVAERIQGLRSEGVPLHEIAVLFRSGFHSYKLELELANRHLEFEKRGGLKLTESAHIKDVLAYLRVVANPDDRLSWNRLLLQIDKVGPKTAQKVLEAVKSAQACPLDALESYPAAKSLQNGLSGLVDMLRSISVQGATPSGQLDGVLDYYRPIFERIYHDDFPRRARDLDQLKVLLAGYETLQAFLDDTALDPPQSETTDGVAVSAGERLVLSTVHSAKGLEWDTVFVIHLTDGKFPSVQAVTPEEREEERRLLYVAATRARRRLFLVYPRMAMTPERFVASTVVSPYVEELPATLLQKSPGSNRSSFSVRSSFLDDADDDEDAAVAVSSGKESDSLAAMRVGTLVRHPFFGEGKVHAIAGPRTVDVFFVRNGHMTLHLDYARLEVI
jgi:DNA helicase-2/ATP-dependent DNA helicase PcrA